MQVLTEMLEGMMARVRVDGIGWWLEGRYDGDADPSQVPDVKVAGDRPVVLSVSGVRAISWGRIGNGGNGRSETLMVVLIYGEPVALHRCQMDVYPWN